MKVHIVHYGETSPIDQGYRPQRYGLLSRALVAAGHEVVRFLPSFSHGERAIRDVTPNEVYRTKDEGSVVHLPTRGYTRSRGLGRMRFLGDFRRQVAATVGDGGRFGQPDILLIGYPPAGAIARIGSSARVARVPLVVDIRDVWPDAQVNPLPRGIRGLARAATLPVRVRNRVALECADALLATSSTYLNWGVMQLRSSPRCGLHVSYIGCAPAESMGDCLPGNETEAVFLGSLSSHFDFDLLIRGWAKFLDHVEPERRGDFRLNIVGDGPLRSRVERLSREVQGVNVAGYLPQAEAQLVASRASIGIAPYRENAQMSLPNKLFEYASMGLPVVSTLPGEAAEFIEVHGLGVTVRPDDDDLTTALVELLCRSGPAARLRRSSLVSASGALSSDSIYRDTVTFLESVVAEYPG